MIGARSIYSLAAAILLGVAIASPVQAGMAEAMSAYRQADYAEAARHMRPLAERGEAKAQFWLGRLHASGRGVPKDHQEAMRWFERAGGQGHVMAQLSLGVMYEKGYSRQHGYGAAMAWYRKAAVRGNAAAQFNLGRMYRLGHGVLQDFVQAYKWFALAAAQGNETARRWRDKAAHLLGPADLAKARALVRDWKPGR
jgi:TPR repeat protein